MTWSTFGPDVLANVVGGVVAAVLIAMYIRSRGKRTQDIQAALIEIMGRAIVHRNLGEKKAYSDPKEWLQQAKALEAEATKKAKELSPAAGAHIEWLDRVPPYNPKSDVAKYVSILSTIIERIREILEREARGA